MSGYRCAAIARSSREKWSIVYSSRNASSSSAFVDLAPASAGASKRSSARKTSRSA
jgi:hypothetical protein